MQSVKKNRAAFALALISLVSGFLTVPVVLLAAAQTPHGPFLTAR
jgi:hypothetical protein